MNTSDTSIAAFAGSELIARGDLRSVVRAARERLDAEPSAQVLLFDAVTSYPVDIDLRGTVDDVLARLPEDEAEPPAPRSPGRPKLGVVAREVTLLPRHWDWLATQPGGASATLRKLVENARRDGSGADRRRTAQESVYRFAVAMAGNEPGFEEAVRALYACDETRFSAHTEAWPVDVRGHARDLASAAFLAGEA